MSEDGETPSDAIAQVTDADIDMDDENFENEKIFPISNK